MKRKIRANGATLEYTLIQTVRRDILIQALEGGLTRVYAPKHARLSDIDKVVKENAEKIAAMAESLKPAPLKDGDFIRVEGTPRRVSIIIGKANVQLTEDEFRITAPDPENADAVRALVPETTYRYLQAKGHVK